MPFYKLFCIAAHYPEYKHIKDLVSQSAKLLLDQGSAVRQIQYHGTRVLPQRMKRHKAKHDAGDYWTMHFDTSPRVLAALNERLRTDPRVVRWTMLKLGERLEDVVRDPSVTVAVDENLLDLTYPAQPRGGWHHASGAGAGDGEDVYSGILGNASFGGFGSYAGYRSSGAWSGERGKTTDPFGQVAFDYRPKRR